MNLKNTLEEQIGYYNFPCPDKGNTPFSIFYIDDSTADTWLAVTIIKLTEIAQEVVTATNGEEGLKIIEEYFSKNNKLPEVIIADLQMPRLDGFDLIRKIKLHPGYSEDCTKLILITAGLDEVDTQKINEIGIKYVLLKPLEKDELLKIIR